MASLLQDLRFGVRMLFRSWTFTATAIIALALGIGATSAIVSVVYGVLLKPLPYREAEQLVRVYENNPVERFQMFPMSPADFLDYRKQNRVFQDIVTYVRQDQQYGGDHPERLIGVRVSHGFFRLFGIEPMLGREFTQEEESTSGATDVAIAAKRWGFGSLSICSEIRSAWRGRFTIAIPSPGSNRESRSKRRRQQ